MDSVLNLVEFRVLGCVRCTKSELCIAASDLLAFMAWQESRLALQEQDVAIMKTVKSELARVPGLEKELKHLREDNAFLRSNIFSCVDWTTKHPSAFK